MSPDVGGSFAYRGPLMRVTVYRAKDGWRWKLVASNGELTAESGEGYVNKAHAVRMAAEMADAIAAELEVPE